MTILSEESNCVCIILKPIFKVILHYYSEYYAVSLKNRDFFLLIVNFIE
jgi:hypothetical protein